MDNNKEHIDESLLMQFLLGETDQEDKKRVERWLNSSARNRLYLDKLEAVWSEAGRLTPVPVAVDVSGAWSRMSERIDIYDKGIIKEGAFHVSFKSRVIRMTLRAAAIIVLAFGIYQLVKLPERDSGQVVVQGAVKPVRDTLPDGSRIALNSNSVLKYPKTFKKDERQVILEGEAFFEVEHDRDKPFVIKAEEAVIEVLGTSFNVKAYPGKDVEVWVEKGLVRLSKTDEDTGNSISVNLPAGKKGIMPVRAVKPTISNKSFSDDLFWLNRKLVFEDTRLPVVFRLLEDYYNVEIEVADSSILKCSYSSIFEDDSVDEILEVIAASFNLELEKDKGNYIYKRKGSGDED